MNSHASSSKRRGYQFEFRDDDVFTKFMIDLRIKNGVAVDPQSCHVQDAHVYRDSNGDPFSAYLTETDVENRRNCYYKLQILEPDDPATVSSMFVHTYFVYLNNRASLIHSYRILLVGTLVGCFKLTEE